jgi:hypothetical protein
MKAHKSWSWALGICCALLVGGCGAVPDLIVDEVRSSAKEAFQEAVGEMVDEAIGEVFGEFLDVEDLPMPFETEGEGE